MSSDKGIFQRALEAIVEGRSRQAQRYVDSYMETHKAAPDRKR